MLKESIKQYYNVLKFKPYNNNYYKTLEYLNEALDYLRKSKMYDYFVDKYFDKIDKHTVIPKSMELINDLKNEIAITRMMFLHMSNDLKISYNFRTNIDPELNLINESLSNLLHYYNLSIKRLNYINEVADGVHDYEIDILESILSNYEYDVVGGKLIIRYPEIKIEEDYVVSSKRKGFNIIKDTYLFINLDIRSLNESIHLMIMKPSYSQIAKSLGFPHINGGIHNPTSRFCFGITPPDISGDSNYINNIIKVVLYFDVYLRKKFTTSVYNNLVDNNFIERINNETVSQNIPNNINVYKRRFQGAYILDYEIEFEGNSISIDDLGILSLNTHSESHRLSPFTFVFKGKYVKQEFDEQKIINNQEIQSIIKNKIYVTKQSKLLALYAFKKTIEKLVESEHHRGSGEEDQNTMYEDTFSRMGRINTVALFRGRTK